MRTSAVSSSAPPAVKDLDRRGASSQHRRLLAWPNPRRAEVKTRCVLAGADRLVRIATARGDDAIARTRK